MIGIMIWIIAKNNQLFLDTYPNPPKISSKLVGNFLNYPTTTDRQTDRQTHRVKKHNLLGGGNKSSSKFGCADWRAYRIRLRFCWPFPWTWQDPLRDRWRSRGPVPPAVNETRGTGACNEDKKLWGDWKCPIVSEWVSE